jgi:hypothetical protein
MAHIEVVARYGSDRRAPACHDKAISRAHFRELNVSGFMPHGS